MLPHEGDHRYRDRYRGRSRNRYRLWRTIKTDCDCDPDTDPDTDAFGFLLPFSKQALIRRGRTHVHENYLGSHTSLNRFLV
jgi:hypothetical protein